ncbi:MAG TPA: glycosyltransferase family 2 protein [Candidatus Omnitrophota bacterium]|nr:glycosyltransferase family 2 protein [Candidatus Omnitrophota bacterium]
MIYVFLPAYNEEVALPRLVEKFDETFKRDHAAYRVVVLDDGSSDGTHAAALKLAERYPMTVLRHEVNQGLGQTMIDGLAHCAAISASTDLVVTLDCDDTHEPKYVHAAIDKIHQGYDLVILSRYQSGGGEMGLSLVKSVLSRGAGLFLKLFFPIKGVHEYSCGYRVFRSAALKSAFLTLGSKFVELPHMGFVVTPEILIKFRMLGFRIAEVPFVLNYGQKPGASKNKPLKTIMGYFHLVLRCWGRRVDRAGSSS